MPRFLAIRLALAVSTLFLIVVASFFLQRSAPGGPFDRDREMPERVRRELEREWLLDRPLGEQLGAYLRGLLSIPPDLKSSMIQPEFRVAEIIGPRLRVSLTLGAAALVFSLAVGIPAGVLAALRRRRPSEHLLMFLALVGISVPPFVFGPLAKRLFALDLGWLPESRWQGPRSMVLPVLTLSLATIATAARLVRSSMIEALDRDHVRAARARGLPEWRVICVHALPGALTPICSWLGPAAAGLCTGSVVVERIFSIPGLGQVFVDAAFNRDYTVVMGVVIVYSSILLACNIGADLLLAAIDPRTRSGR